VVQRYFLAAIGYNFFPLPVIKPPFLNKPPIHFATPLNVLVNSYYIKAPRIDKSSSFKDYKILKDNNTFSFIRLTVANTNRKVHRRITIKS
jgi:hypothetical protein